jgi:hypothetical protein
VKPRVASLVALFFAGTLVSAQPTATDHAPLRLVIVKVDGLNADLLYEAMRQMDPDTGKPRLPWLAHIFRDNGTIFENFYTRGISLSAPSWSMLDTGHHAIIRGNVEYDRFTGEVYDYLNFFPFYLGYARSRHVDMPGVEVLDRAGIPLIIDALSYPHVYQSFQLFQRGVRWTTLARALRAHFASRSVLSLVEAGEGASLDESLGLQTEHELIEALENPSTLYLDFFTGDADHEGHATNQEAALFNTLKRLDSLTGRLWSAIQSSSLAKQTVLVMVSDHGMNNTPGVFSQGFSLPDLLNGPQGGAHHIVTNRHQLSDYKIRGLDPLVRRVITPSTASFYLAGESSRYPTAWLDLDGNERASLHLRNSDLNKIHILLLQLSRPELPTALRAAAAKSLAQIIDHHRAAWNERCSQLEQEVQALEHSIADAKEQAARQSGKVSKDEKAAGLDKEVRRFNERLTSRQRELEQYNDYRDHLRKLLTFHPDSARPFTGRIADLVPELSLGDNNSVEQLQHYIAGPGPQGLVLDSAGALDEARSFRHIDYFALFAAQRVRNNPQPKLTSRPIDFVAMRLLYKDVNKYWLYADDSSQLLITQNGSGDIALEPIKRLKQEDDGHIGWIAQPWRSGLPLHLFEDQQLRIPPGVDRAAWLSGRHSEREWVEVTHKCLYSNAVIGITEQFSPVAANVPGPPGISPLLLAYERRRRESVQPDLQLFASDHWNFNTRNFNPGGNHGSFFRISTHSVWMMSGAGVPGKSIEEPYDSLNFASTVLSAVGRTPPMPDRVVRLR